MREVYNGLRLLDSRRTRYPLKVSHAHRPALPCLGQLALSEMTAVVCAYPVEGGSCSVQAGRPSGTVMPGKRSRRTGWRRVWAGSKSTRISSLSRSTSRAAIRIRPWPLAPVWKNSTVTGRPRRTNKPRRERPSQSYRVVVVTPSRLAACLGVSISSSAIAAPTRHAGPHARLVTGGLSPPGGRTPVAPGDPRGMPTNGTSKGKNRKTPID